MAIHRVNKTSSEKFPVTLDFTNALPDGVTVSSVAVTDKKRSDGTTDTSILESTSPTPSSNTVAIQVKAGTNGESYIIQVAATGSDAFTVLEEYIILEVKDVPWA